MRNFLFFVIFSVISAVTAKASDSTTTVTPTVTKWTDVSLWQVVRVKAPQKGPILWFSHEHVRFFLETRLNFDWSNTAGFIMGKTISPKGKFWLTPKAGLLFGATKDAYNGSTFEINLGGSKKSFSYFSMSQLAVSFQMKNPHFIYEFVDLKWNICKFFALSNANQLYWEIGSKKPAIDLGPQLTLSVKGFYWKTWYTGNPISHLQKVTFGFGYLI